MKKPNLNDTTTANKSKLVFVDDFNDTEVNIEEDEDDMDTSENPYMARSQIHNSNF